MRLEATVSHGREREDGGREEGGQHPPGRRGCGASSTTLHAPRTARILAGAINRAPTHNLHVSTNGVSGGGGRVLLTILFALVLISSVFPTASAHAASNGRISGQLLDGSKNNAPVAGQSVTLQIAQGDTAHDVTSVKTDGDGSFTFDGLATDKLINYAVYTRYQGAQYYTGLISLSTTAQQQVNLTVYEATTSATNIVIVQATVLLHKPDTQAGVLSVSEIFFFKNVGTNSYVGSLDASKGKPNALRFALPLGARNIALSKGFDGYHIIQVDRGFATDAALPPGASQFVFSFELPYTTSNYNVSYSVLYPTAQFSLLIPTDVNINSNTLTSAGIITADQRPYRLFQAKNLLAGSEIQAQLQGLPTTQSSASPLNQRTIWLVVGLLLLLAILAVTWFLYRATHRPVPHRRRDPVGAGVEKGGDGTLVVARGVGRGSNSTKDISESPQQALVQELLQLDKAYEAGKLKKAAYQEQRAKTKARLRTLMSEEALSRVSKDTVKTMKKTAKSGKDAS